MGALRQRAHVREAGHYLRVAHRQAGGSFWKFYLGYTVYRVPLDLITELGNVPERVLEELSFGERRMLHYLASHRNGMGCCYIRQHGKITRRFLALQSLVHKNIVKLAYCDANVVFFKLADTFSKQQKFNIHKCRYFTSGARDHVKHEGERWFLKIVTSLF